MTNVTLWQYKVHLVRYAESTHGEAVEQLLNQFGIAGWELVTTFDTDSSVGFVFKKAIPGGIPSQPARYPFGSPGTAAPATGMEPWSPPTAVPYDTLLLENSRIQ